MRKNFTKTMMLVAAMLCGLSANAEAFTVSFDTMANWLWGFSATNYIVAWNNDGDITAPGTGDLMSFDEDENLYVWTAPEGKVPTKLYFHNGSGKRTWVFDAENGKTYNNLFNSVVISIDGESEDIWVDTEDGVTYMKDMLNIPAGTKFTIRDAIKESDLYWGGKTNMELGTVYELAKYGADCTLKEALANGTMEFNYANQTVKFSAFELAPHSWPEDGSVLTEFYMFEITYGPGDCTYSKVEGIDEPMVNVYRVTETGEELVDQIGLDVSPYSIVGEPTAYEEFETPGDYVIRFTAGSFKIANEEAGVEELNKAFDIHFTIFKPSAISVTPEPGSDIEVVSTVKIEYNTPLNTMMMDSEYNFYIDGSTSQYITATTSYENDNKTLVLTVDESVKQLQGKYELSIYPVYANGVWPEADDVYTWNVAGNVPAHEYEITPANGSTLRKFDGVRIWFDTKVEAGDVTTVNMLNTRTSQVVCQLPITVENRWVTISVPENTEIPDGNYRFLLNEARVRFENGDMWKDIQFSYTVDSEYVPEFKFDIFPANDKPITNLDGFNMYITEPEDATAEPIGENPQAGLYGPGGELIENFDLMIAGVYIGGTFSQAITSAGAYTIKIPAGTFNYVFQGAEFPNEEIAIPYECMAYVEPEVLGITPENGSELKELTEVRIQFNKAIDAEWVQYAEYDCVFVIDGDWSNCKYPAVSLSDDGCTLIMTLDGKEPGLYTASICPYFADQNWMPENIELKYTVLYDGPSHSYTVNPEDGSVLAEFKQIVIEFDTELEAGDDDFANLFNPETWYTYECGIEIDGKVATITLKDTEPEVADGNYTMTINKDKIHFKNGDYWKIIELHYTVDHSTGVGTIKVDDSNAVYYNLQGVPVANPEGGVYIKVAGNKVTKEIKK